MAGKDNRYRPSVDVHVTRLRSKISPYGRNIVSRSGYGYGWQD